MAGIDSEPTLRADELFTARLIGYSFDEVDAYVEDTARRMRRLIAEIQRLSAANRLLDEALEQNTKLAAELAEARPHATIGPRVQSIMRLAEQEADELRVTAGEVLAEARREADAIRVRAEHDADKARRDHELALDQQRRDEQRQRQEQEAAIYRAAEQMFAPKRTVPENDPAGASEDDPGRAVVRDSGGRRPDPPDLPASAELQDGSNAKGRRRGRSGRRSQPKDGMPAAVLPGSENAQGSMRPRR